MSRVLPIERLGSPVLRRQAEEVTSFDDELRALVRDMFTTMYHAEGVGLAGPQVGVPKRVLVMDPRLEEEPGGGRMALVNPRVVEASRAVDKASEGCLSIPGVDEVVERALEVVVEARTPEGDPVRLHVEGFAARVLQHEIDHLDGILFIDRLTPLKRELLLKRYRRLLEEEAAGAS